MKAINFSYKNKSLIEFNQVLREYNLEVLGDQILKLHIESLYQALLERNLFNVIKPYSRVQITYVAQRMHLDYLTIQNKYFPFHKLIDYLNSYQIKRQMEHWIREMDVLFYLIPLNQMYFILLTNQDLYKNSLDVINNMNIVVEKLSERMKIK